MTKWLYVLPASAVVMLLASCGSEQSGQNAQSYKDTKAIVLDILKTEDAQKAILEAQQKSQDKTAKLLSTGDGQQIQLAVKDVLTNPESSKLLEKTMTDPKFAGDFAKATQKNMKQLHKDLLKDPEYQKSLIEVMNNPEFEKMLLNVMKNSAYRKQTMAVMQESLQSPLFKTQLLDLMQKAVEQQMKMKDEGQTGKSGGQSQDQQKGQDSQSQDGQKSG